jgi:hypothetical protein
LLGTADVAWTPYLTSIVPALQAIVLIGGLVWASITARRIAAEKQSEPRATWLALPVVGYCLIVTIGLIGLLIG